MHPFSFATGYMENEVFHLGQMLKQEDRASFGEAMEKEISSYNQQQHWKIVPKTKAGRTKIIKSIWSFKQKRTPNREITKHKARIYAHGRM